MALSVFTFKNGSCTCLNFRIGNAVLQVWSNANGAGGVVGLLQNAEDSCLNFRMSIN